VPPALSITDAFVAFRRIAQSALGRRERPNRECHPDRMFSG